MRHIASRGLLAVLSGFIAVTALAGAAFVVPTLPLEWLEGSVLSDYTIPALALGLVGLSAVVTLAALVVGPEAAGAFAVVTGTAMVIFELVEIWVVGFSLVEYGIGEPVAWLQVIYLVVGAMLAGVGLSLWRATGREREGSAPAMQSPANPMPR
jgi:predicted membrane-bound mannosyltransferase